MDTHKFISDILVAIIAQALSIASSVITTLVLPKVLGIEAFGYLQLFLFYASYLGFFHFGINDGIYLIKGGQGRTEIDKKDVNSQFAFSCAYQLIISTLIFFTAVFGPFEDDRAFVIAATSLLLTIYNAEFFLGYVFQAMNETKLFALSSAIETFSFFAGLIPLLVSIESSFEPYVVLFCGAKTIRFAFCAFKARDFFRSGLYPVPTVFKNSLLSIRVGIKLMLANIVSTSILGVIRFFVDLEWGIETFSVVSFSLSITSFFLLFLSQVSMVLFPHLRQTDRATRDAIFTSLRDGLGIFLPSLYLLYPLVALLLSLWVPEYEKSIEYFLYLFPICVFDGKMDLVSTTYFKVTRKESLLFAVNVATFAASSIGTIVGVYYLHSISFVLSSVALILGLRCFLSERLLSDCLKIKQSTLSWSTILISALFITSFSLFESLNALVVYAIAYILFLFVYRKRARSFFSILRKPKRDTSA